MARVCFVWRPWSLDADRGPLAIRCCVQNGASGMFAIRSSRAGKVAEIEKVCAARFRTLPDLINAVKKVTFDVGWAFSDCGARIFASAPSIQLRFPKRAVVRTFRHSAQQTPVFHAKFQVALAIQCVPNLLPRLYQGGKYSKAMVSLCGCDLLR